MPKFEPGAYYMTGIELGTGQSTNKGTPYLYIKGIISQQAKDGGWTPVASPEVRQIELYLSGGAMPITMRQIEPLGFNGDFDNPAFAADKMAGLVVYCEHEAGQKGGSFEKWALEQRGSFTKENKPLDSKAVRDLNARWRAAKGGAAAPKLAPPPAPSAGPKPPTGDEIPF